MMTTRTLIEAGGSTLMAIGAVTALALVATRGMLGLLICCWLLALVVIAILAP